MAERAIEITPELAEDIVDLTERMQRLGVASFSLGGLKVTFRRDVPVPGEVAATPLTPKVLLTPREQAAKTFGELKFPGQV